MSHMHNPIGNNAGVPKIPSSQILAANLDRLIGRGRAFDSNNQLADKAKVAQSHIGRMRRQESSATVDMLDALADAIGVEPWELLTDSEVTRRNAIERMLTRGPAANEEPRLQLAAKRVKKRPKKGGT